MRFRLTLPFFAFTFLIHILHHTQRMNYISFFGMDEQITENNTAYMVGIREICQTEDRNICRGTAQNGKKQIYKKERKKGKRMNIPNMEDNEIV